MTGAKTNKHPGGRPSKYEVKYCLEVVDFLAKGQSVTAFVGNAAYPDPRSSIGRIFIPSLWTP
jgi:hypothetical protein